LAFQAEPITGFLGLVWAALHLIGTVMYWYEDNA
jgi:hypothetical protein